MLFEYNKDSGVIEDILDKTELLAGKTYFGYCRNASFAIWSGTNFVYLRDGTVRGTYYTEELPHPADDDGTDVFVPLRNLNPLNVICFRCLHMYDILSVPRTRVKRLKQFEPECPKCACRIYFS